MSEPSRIGDIPSRPTITEAEEYRCRCGATIHHPGACDVCIARFERRRAKESRAEAYGTIPARFRWAIIGADELATRCGQSQIAGALTALDLLKAGHVDTVILTGRAGSGKTSLACALLQNVISTTETGWAARYMSALTLSRVRTDSSLGVTPWEITSAIKASTLVLDDLGQESIGHDVIREIVHARHDAERPTIVTTWLDQILIAERYGGGTSRRLFESCAFIRMGGER